MAAIHIDTSLNRQEFKETSVCFYEGGRRDSAEFQFNSLRERMLWLDRVSPYHEHSSAQMRPEECISPRETGRELCAGYAAVVASLGVLVVINRVPQRFHLRRHF